MHHTIIGLPAVERPPADVEHTTRIDYRAVIAAQYHADREQLLDLAAACVQDSDSIACSTPNIERIGQAYADLDTLMVTAEIQHSADQRSIRMLEDLRVAALAEATDLRAECARLSAELAALRTHVALDSACLAVAGVSAAEVAAHLSDEERRARNRKTLLERQRAETRQIVHREEMRAFVRSSAMVFDVSDTDVVDEPTAGRSQTVRVAPALEVFP